MAKFCISCGKSIGMLSVRIPLLPNEEQVICSECYERMPEIIDELYRDRIFPSKEELVFFKENVLQQLKASNFNQETLDVVSEFMDNKISYAKNKSGDTYKIREEELALIEEKKKTFKLTTGYNFEGYSITEYIDIVDSEVVLGTGFFSEVSAQLDDFFGVSSSPYENKIAHAKKAAKEKLIYLAIQKGANALIGVDFDIMTIGNNMIVVSASGTAVVIETK